MSNVSINSSRRGDQEKIQSELLQELESVKALNSSLQAYLEHLRLFKKNIQSTNENCQQLNNINLQWIETLNLMRN